MPVPVAVKAALGLTRALMEEGADGPAAAMRLDDLSFAGGRALHRLIRRGVVREAEPGRYWLDGAAYEAWCIARRDLVLWMLMIVGVAAVVLMAYVIFRFR